MEEDVSWIMATGALPPTAAELLGEARGEDSREVRRNAISNCSTRDSFLDGELMSKVLRGVNGRSEDPLPSLLPLPLF
jgi:hypothetical protein